MRLAIFIVSIALTAAFDGAGAGDLDRQEKLLHECSSIYEQLCAGIDPSPEMFGECLETRPGIAREVPEKCQADFRANVENYRDALKNGGR